FDLFGGKHKRGRQHMTPEAMQLCERFPWPGNVRQLRNAVERIVITSRSNIVDVSGLPDYVRDFDRHSLTFTVRPGTPLADVEKQLIGQTLKHVTSNREKAAKSLGISRRALQYKLKRYGMLDDCTKPEASVQ